MSTSIITKILIPALFFSSAAMAQYDPHESQVIERQNYEAQRDAEMRNLQQEQWQQQQQMQEQIREQQNQIDRINAMSPSERSTYGRGF